MPRQLPPLNALRAFEAAGRQSSFSRAADELNVTHAAISRHVRGLEKRLGVQLFRNVSRGVELTEHGTKFLLSVTPAFDQIAKATEDLSQANEGLVSISCETVFAVKWLMPRIGEFYEQNPNVEVKIESSSKLADIQHYECDLAIRFLRDGVQEPGSDLICRSVIYPTGAPHLKSSPHGDDSPSDILRQKLIHERNANLWHRWFLKAGVTGANIPKASNPLRSLLAIEAAIAGQGVALIPDELGADSLADGRLMRFSSIGLDYGGYFLVYLKETSRRKEVQSIRNWLLEQTRYLRAET